MTSRLFLFIHTVIGHFSLAPSSSSSSSTSSALRRPISRSTTSEDTLPFLLMLLEQHPFSFYTILIGCGLRKSLNPFNKRDQLNVCG